MIPDLQTAVITDPAPAELIHFPLIHDSGDPLSSELAMCQGALIGAWYREFGFGDLPFKPEETVNFAIRSSGVIIGAGSIYDLTITEPVTGELHVSGSLIVSCSVLAVEEFIRASVDGYEATPVDPQSAYTKVVMGVV